MDDGPHLLRPAVLAALWRARLILLAAWALVMSLSFGQGFIASDDLDYARLASALIPGGIDPPVFNEPNHHESRIGMTFPLAFLFLVVGIGPAVLAILPLMCTVATVVLTAWIASRFWGDVVGLIAGVLYTFIPFATIGATTYMPEPMVGLTYSLAAALFLLASEKQNKTRGYLLYLAGLITGLGYLATEAGALTLGVLYSYMFATRRLTIPDTLLLAGFASVFCGELLYHTLEHGEPLYRYMHTAGYAEDPMVRGANADLVDRLLKAYPRMFIIPSMSFGVMGPLLILGGVYGMAKWRTNLLFILWAAVIVLFYNFMSGSVSRYVALPVASRLLVPALVPLVIMLAKLLVDLWVWIGSLPAKSMRAPLRFAGAVAGLGVVAVSLTSMYMATRSSLIPAIGRNAVIAAEFLSAHPAATLITDRTSAKAVQFLRDFRGGDSFLTYREGAKHESIVAENEPGGPVLLVVNGAVINEERITGHSYGGGRMITDGDRDGLRHLQGQAGEPVFRGKAPRNGVMGALLESGVVRSLLGPYNHDLARNLWVEDEQLSEITIFRIDRPGSPAYSANR